MNQSPKTTCLSEVIQTQRLLEEDIIKANVSQELPGNSDGCFHLKSVLQITPTAFMLGKNSCFQSHVQVMYKTLEKPSPKKKRKTKKKILLRLTGMYHTSLGPFPVKELYLI